jgi:PEP-CTERM motif
MKIPAGARLAALAIALTSRILCQHAQAAGPMVGDVTFAGSVSLDSTTVNNATMVTAWHGLAAGDLPQVQSRDGDFATFISRGDGTTFHAPWSFNSLSTISGFWTVDGFTFDLLTSHIVQQGLGSLTVAGTGTASGHGFDPTPGTWMFTTQDPSSQSQFSFSASTSVPEPGTVGLLGIGMAGLCGRRLLPKKHNRA